MLKFYATEPAASSRTFRPDGTEVFRIAGARIRNNNNDA
jgi:hypothetical protein